jgi:hypothetical protein
MEANNNKGISSKNPTKTKEEEIDEEEEDDEDLEQDEEDSEEEDEEPKLKYLRLGANVLDILKSDAGSCMAVHDKFLVSKPDAIIQRF